MDYNQLLKDIRGIVEDVLEEKLEEKLDERFLEFEIRMDRKMDLKLEPIRQELAELKESNQRDHERLEREIHGVGAKVDRLYNVFALANELLQRDTVSAV